MVSQDDFPDVWSCDSNNKRVAVEVRVPTGETNVTLSGPFPIENPEYTWIEIPTTSVEQWIEKGKSADIQRTAKVRFPTEWGDDSATVTHNSPRKIIEQFSPTENQPYMLARVIWQSADGTRIIGHLGWVGGVGPASDEGLSKMWIYDFAELLTGVPIGVTLENIDVAEAMDIIVNETNRNTPIPVANSVIVPPNTEEEFAKTIDDYTSPGQSGDRLIRFDGPTVLSLASTDVDPDTIGSAYYSFADAGLTSPRALDNETFSSVAQGETHSFQTEFIGEQTNFDVGGESFTTNRHTLQDVYDWFERRTNASLFFTPQSDAVTLVADVVPERRLFADQNVIEYIDDKFSNIRETVGDIADTELLDELPFDITGLSTGDGYRPHQNVRIIENDALYEMKPMNTLHLRGASRKGLFADQSSPDYNGSRSITYPSVKAVHPGLLEASDGYELAPEVVESDATTLEQAEFEAKKALREELSETSEGEIIMNGTPRILPFDRLDAFEQCGDDIKFEQVPVQYEVESVKHEKMADDIFKTRLQVSIWANDRTIDIVESTMVETSP